MFPPPIEQPMKLVYSGAAIIVLCDSWWENWKPAFKFPLKPTQTSQLQSGPLKFSCQDRDLKGTGKAIDWTMSLFSYTPSVYKGRWKGPTTVNFFFNKLGSSFNHMNFTLTCMMCNAQQLAQSLHNVVIQYMYCKYVNGWMDGKIKVQLFWGGGLNIPEQPNCWRQDI